MNLPLILHDINNKVIGKNVVVSNTNFFIKSYKKFNIRLLDEYEIDLDGNVIIKTVDDENPLDDPKIYSVLSDTDIRSGMEFTGVDVNYSYTVYLGKSSKQIKLEISDAEFPDEIYYITLFFKPDNVILETQEHYNSLLINNNLPTYEQLKSAIIDENQHEIIKRLLLDFKEIIKYKGTTKSIKQFLFFIGFNTDSIKIIPEYITPTGVRTINPNKVVDIKTGYYHIIYDAFEYGENKYDSKNLPNVTNSFTNFKEFFDKLLYALILANDYFTVNEQQMSFFGTNNMVNVPQFISLTTQYTQVQKFNTLSFTNNVDIDIYNRTLLDSVNKDIVKDNILVNKNLELSEIKIFEGNHVRQNPLMYLIDIELSDNYNDTILTDEQELQIKYVFGNVLNISVGSSNLRLQYVIKNIDNELMQYKSDVYDLTSNRLEQKIVLELSGKYVITFYVWDYKGNRTEYFYELELLQSNIDFDIFNSKNVLEDENNNLNGSIDSPIITSNVNDENNLSLINSNTNPALSITLENYFEVVDNYESKNLLGLKSFTMPLLNHNIKMSDLTETLPVDYIDNFLHIISIKKLDNTVYEFSDNLFVKLLDINIPETESIEQHYFISTKENSININEFLHEIKIIYNDIEFNTKQILNKELPIELEFKNKILPVNFDFMLDEHQIKSLFPRLQNIEDDINDPYSMMLGDIIVASIDHKYIVNFTDVNWKLINSFTQEIIKNSNELVLKHRINEKTLFDILLTFKINGTQYQILKKSILTSFKI